MSRSSKKGPWVEERLMKRIEALNTANNKKMLRTWSRASTIFPEMVGHTIAVHDGKKHVPVFISASMRFIKRSSTHGPFLLERLIAAPHLPRTRRPSRTRTQGAWRTDRRSTGSPIGQHASDRGRRSGAGIRGRGALPPTDPSCWSDSSLLALSTSSAAHDVCVGALVLLARAVAERRHAPRRDRVATGRRRALAAAVRVVDRVHRRAARLRAHAHVALAPGLADLHVLVLGVAEHQNVKIGK